MAGARQSRFTWAPRLLLLIPALAVWLVAVGAAQEPRGEAGAATKAANQPAAGKPAAGQTAGTTKPLERDPHRPGMFVTSQDCMACHNSLTAPSGEDISIGLSWRSSVMANASRDPYWHASVRRETIDHPMHKADIEDECATCHMPMARAQAHDLGRKGEVFAHLPIGHGDSEEDRLAADGVSCSLCHQITNENFGTRASFVGNFVLNRPVALAPRTMFGPFDVKDGAAAVMHSVTAAKPQEGKHIEQSELCATCHTLITEAFGPSGEVVGSIPEQVPYQEWLHSDYHDQRSCQSCHMPVVAGPTRIASVVGDMRDQMNRHTFVGGNFLLLRMLNRYRSELGVSALPQELDATANRTLRQLESDTATVSIARLAQAAGELDLDVDVRNITGHKLPTGYPSRRAWLHVTVRDSRGQPVFESGAIDANGAIRGNDNDADATTFEPHYLEIRRPDQVQIYESIIADRQGRPTTGLLRATQFIKDNRLLPHGFDKTTAEADIAVHGEAAQDRDFTGEGDRIRYAVDTRNASAPFTVDVELRYQPVGFRWAENLRDYTSAAEPKRFVSYYETMAAGSSTVLAHASAQSQ
jgi:hypothetical protein